MKIEVSIGEVIDKLSILSIKKDRIKDLKKLENVVKEYNYLLKEVYSLGINENNSKWKELLEVNLKLWEIEDKIRDLERKKQFDSEFIELARSVYKTNDLRAKIKLEINLEYKSDLIEEKDYKPY